MNASTTPTPTLTDDLVVPFQIEHNDASGRLVRLGPVVDEILTRHAYPDEVSKVLGQALLLVAMFGSMIKDRRAAAQNQPARNSKERFILQTQTDGPISLIVADYSHPGHLRGYARFDEKRLNELDTDNSAGTALGAGHLAMTIDRGDETDRYQGIVAIDNEGSDDGLSAAANRYFEQSEQLPTLIRLAMAKHFDARKDKGSDNSSNWHWRGGALMVQKLTSVGGHETKSRDWPDASDDQNDDDDNWNRTTILSQSLQDHELLDPLLTSRDLLFHLYHADGVRVFDPLPVKAACSCSLEGVKQMLAGFSKDDQNGMLEEDGKVHITCEFCNRSYALAP